MKTYTSFILLLLLSFSTNAQQDSTTLKNIQDFNPQIHSLSQFLPSLEVILDSALVKSPMIKFWDADMKIQDYKMKSAKINWSRSINLESDLRYGSINNIYIGTGTTQITTTDASRWGVGISLKLPIYEFFNLKNSMNLIAKEKEQSSYKREEIIMLLKKEIIMHYYELIFKEQSLKIRNANSQNTALQLQMAELDFKNGAIPVTELVRLSQQHAVNQFEYEKEKRDFIQELLILQEYIGYRLIK